MSLSLKGLFIALPIVALIIGALAWSTYRGNIATVRANTTRNIAIANTAAAQSLEQQIALIAETEAKAAASMRRKLASPRSTKLEDVFETAADGALHSRDDLWEGRTFPGGIRVQGIGGFAAPPLPTGERRAALLAAFETLKEMSNGLPRGVESLYFFSPENDLLIYAPRRPDQLSFYRNAPADFDFQTLEFSQITSPEANPRGTLRCTSLQRPAYDETGEARTTGCMLPFRIAGRHLGAWGISIPLEDFTRHLSPPPDGAYRIIVSRDGKLVHASNFAVSTGPQMMANVDLARSKNAELRALWEYAEGVDANRNEFARDLGAYVSVRQLEAPAWIVLTVLPERVLREQAWGVARRVILVSLVGALVLGLLLAAIFHRAVALRIARLAARIDRVAATEGMELTSDTVDEIGQLEHAFAQMEQRLARARARASQSFDTLVDAADRYAMILFDEHGRMLRANKGAMDLFADDEIAGLAVRWGIGADEDRDGDVPGKPGPDPAIVRRELADGRAVWLEEALVVLRDDAGEPFATAYIGHDITELHAAQRAIEENLLYLEMAQASASAGHFTLDPQASELSLSSWLREKLGVATPSIPLAQVAELIDPGEREETMAAIAEAIASRSEFSFETLAIDAEGERFHAIVQGTAVFRDASASDELVGFYGIVQDISDQKRAAEELLRARDAARMEARSKTDILAILSHEIRTPISGILGLIDQIRRERSAPERDHALTLIQDSSEALLKTLDATLERTRAEREERIATTEEFRPDELIERVAGLFRPLARRKGLALDVIKGTASPAVGQPNNIQQILANFLSNAIKFTPVGKVAIAVQAPRHGSDNWTFSVEDTGAGIDPERLKTIFEPFSGSAPDTLGRSGGSGLGLSITRDLAEQMGGSVTAESADDGGTRMVLEVPLGAVAATQMAKGDRGRMAIRLAKASLALRVEVMAHEYGFALMDTGDSGSGMQEVDVLVTDDPAIPDGERFRLRIIVLEGSKAKRDGDTIRIGEAALLDALPDLLDEVSDG